MQVANLLLLLSTALTGTIVSAERDYEQRAMKKLVSAQSLLQKKFECEGWSPLPHKPSYSQCLLALERIVKQPQSCAQKYMSGAARTVYDPIYNWFNFGSGIDKGNVIAVAIQFAMNNAVAVQVYDAFNREIANIDASGNQLPLEDDGLGFDMTRTWALNYPTFVRNEEQAFASITQNVWSVQGQFLTVTISKPISLLPIVC